MEIYHKVKIDTQIVLNSRQYYLQDINGNGLSNKTIYLYDGSTLTNTTYITSSDGFFLSSFLIKGAHYVFDGDEDYNGCSYP